MLILHGVQYGLNFDSKRFAAEGRKIFDMVKWPFYTSLLKT